MSPFTERSKSLENGKETFFTRHFPCRPQELFRTFRVPHYNQGSYQNLMLVTPAHTQMHITHTIGNFGLPSLRYCQILIGTLIVMQNPECTEQLFNPCFLDFQIFVVFFRRIPLLFSCGFCSLFRRSSQRALRDILMSRGKNCLPIVSRQFLTRNYPRPNRLLKCLPNCLSPTQERAFFSSFKNYPCGEGNCEAIERQKLPRGNFCPGTSRCLAGPTGFKVRQKEISLLWGGSCLF